jgi:CRISPR-associated protein Cas1
MSDDTPSDLIPLAMLNAFVYCPRRFHYEFVQGVMEDNAHVVHGRRRHARVDDPSLAERPRAEGDAIHTRSVWLTSEAIGITGKIDVVEETAGEVAPVEYKKGRPPSRDQCPDGYWPNDAVQLCAQALLLESANGEACPENADAAEPSRAVPSPVDRREDTSARITVDGSGSPTVERGYLYFAATRQRVEVPMTPKLREQTQDAITAASKLAQSDEEPPPLVDSPKCPSCSLVALCMPDETNRLRAGRPPETGDEAQGDRRVTREAVRCLIPADYDTEILYVTEQGATIGKSGDRFIVRNRQGQTLAEVPGEKLRQVCIYGYAQLTTQAAHACMDLGVDVAFFSTGGRLKGHLAPLPNANGLLRSAAAKALQSEPVRLAVARGVIAAKIHNQRVMLMRNAGDDARGPTFDRDVEHLLELSRTAAEAETRQSLLGIEGSAARLYFSHFADMLRQPNGDGDRLFDFEHRNRRPPRDPVNALLSLGYSCLCKDAISAVAAVGLDPYLGALHESRRGQPALALDLMEEFRPIIADSVVLTLVNNRMLSEGDFLRGRQSCNLTDKGRRTFFGAYEKRKTDECTHPVFDYKTSYVRLIEMQARVIARFLTGQIPGYAGFRTR